MDVDTRSLRYFVELAGQLNFTRAAERLFVSQPALSRSIRRLEEDLRTPLFHRGTEVRLTAAGEALLPLARQLLADWQTAHRTARVAAAERERVLRVGFTASGGGPLATRAYVEYVRRFPDRTVEPKSFEWGGEVAALRDGLVDVAYVWLPADTTGLRTWIIGTEPRYAGLPVHHPLAGRADLSILDLTGDPIAWTRRAPREWVDWWAVNPRPDGSVPRWGPENDNTEEMLEHVAAGRAICLCPESMTRNYRRPDLVWIPVLDIPPLRIAVCRLDSPSGEPADDFLAVALEQS